VLRHLRVAVHASYKRLLPKPLLPQVLDESQALGLVVSVEAAEAHFVRREPLLVLEFTEAADERAVHVEDFVNVLAVLDWYLLEHRREHLGVEDGEAAVKYLYIVVIILRVFRVQSLEDRELVHEREALEGSQCDLFLQCRFSFGER